MNEADLAMRAGRAWGWTFPRTADPPFGLGPRTLDPESHCHSLSPFVLTPDALPLPLVRQHDLEPHGTWSTHGPPAPSSRPQNSFVLTWSCSPWILAWTPGSAPGPLDPRLDPWIRAWTPGSSPGPLDPRLDLWPVRSLSDWLRLWPLARVPGGGYFENTRRDAAAEGGILITRRGQPGCFTLGAATEDCGS